MDLDNPLTSEQIAGIKDDVTKLDKAERAATRLKQAGVEVEDTLNKIRAAKDKARKLINVFAPNA